MIDHTNDCEDTVTVLGDCDLELLFEDEPTIVDADEPSFKPPSAPRPWHGPS